VTAAGGGYGKVAEMVNTWTSNSSDASSSPSPAAQPASTASGGTLCDQVTKTLDCAKSTIT
jgi:hypothetical protein